MPPKKPSEEEYQQRFPLSEELVCSVDFPALRAPPVSPPWSSLISRQAFHPMKPKKQPLICTGNSSKNNASSSCSAPLRTCLVSTILHPSDHTGRSLRGFVVRIMCRVSSEIARMQFEVMCGKALWRVDAITRTRQDFGQQKRRRS